MIDTYGFILYMYDGPVNMIMHCLFDEQLQA